jgi:hypothetical protein
MLSRRQFAGRALAACGAIAAGGMVISRNAFGYATVKGDGRPSLLKAMEGPAIHIRKAYWNGCDITQTCFEVDRDAGLAKVFLAKESDSRLGQIELLDGAKGELHGTITIEWDDQPESPLKPWAIVGANGKISILPQRTVVSPMVAKNPKWQKFVPGPVRVSSEGEIYREVTAIF